MKCPICKGEMEKENDFEGFPINFCLTCGIQKKDYTRRRLK